MTRYQLYIDLISANARAGDLERIANRLKKAAESVSNEIHAVTNNWTGNAASEYIKKGNLLVEKMMAEARAIDSYAQTIRRIAKRTYETEIKALDTANSRTYH